MGTQWGHSGDTVGTEWGHSEDTVGTQWGHSRCIQRDRVTLDYEKLGTSTVRVKEE